MKLDVRYSVLLVGFGTAITARQDPKSWAFAGLLGLTISLVLVSIDLMLRDWCSK